MDLELVFRAILALILMGFVAHRGYYSRKFPLSKEETLQIQTQDLVGKLANLLAFLALAASIAHILFPRRMSWSAVSRPSWVRWGGVGLAATGFALLEWSHSALGHNWSDQPRITQKQRLVTDGPYRWIRHPIYTSFILILGSCLFISANWLIGVLWVVATGIDINSRIRFEEEKMIERFKDDYHVYMEHTGSLIPRL